MIKIKIEKLVFGGQGLGHLSDGRVCFVWNALPGEEVEIELTRNKKDYCEGIAKKIITSSPYRIEPRDSHFLSCSPWQILDPIEEDRWKVEMGKETYKKLADLDWNLEIINDEKIFGYRNKMEFSFAQHQRDGSISLGFFNRGAKDRYAIDKCELADPLINETALNVLAWINKNKITLRSLKAMIVRSNSQGQVIVALFIKDKMKFTNYPELSNSFVGFQLYYSTHKSPASVPTALLYSVGLDYLITELNGINPNTNLCVSKLNKVNSQKNILDLDKKPNDIGVGVKLKFGLLSFFQIHLSVFQMALADIGKFLDKEKPVVDFYSGVGAIALPLHDKYKDAILVESNEEAVEYAKENIKINKINNCEAVLSPSEKIVDLITKDKIIIFDPPRAGLHEDIIKQVLNTLPERIIYLSCNLATQARDIKMLGEKYQVKFLKLYNFFPRTPHVEGLCVLELK